MAIIDFSVGPHEIQENAVYSREIPGSVTGFPFFVIDVDSYIVGVQVHSGIDFDIAGGRHCVAIGKGCSLAENLVFMIDMNHDYGAVSQGELSFLQGVKFGQTIPGKEPLSCKTMCGSAMGQRSCRESRFITAVLW